MGEGKAICWSVVIVSLVWKMKLKGGWLESGVSLDRVV